MRVFASSSAKEELAGVSAKVSHECRKLVQGPESDSLFAPEGMSRRFGRALKSAELVFK
jgi:hypothetical protein